MASTTEKLLNPPSIQLPSADYLPSKLLHLTEVARDSLAFQIPLNGRFFSPYRFCQFLLDSLTRLSFLVAFVSVNCTDSVIEQVSKSASIFSCCCHRLPPIESENMFRSVCGV